MSGIRIHNFIGERHRLHSIGSYKFNYHMNTTSPGNMYRLIQDFYLLLDYIIKYIVVILICSNLKKKVLVTALRNYTNKHEKRIV
jgi:hypothetical protein